MSGTDDGLVQVTEDGGKNWRKVESFAGRRRARYVTDCSPSPRDADTVFATFNNYQRGDFKPYVMKSADRGRTWTSITGDLPQRSGRVEHRAGSRRRQPAVRGHGVRRLVHGRRRRSTGCSSRAASRRRRRATLRSSDARTTWSSATFGRGVYILDDYSALRELTPQALAENAHLFPLRDAYLYDELGQVEAAWGDAATPNPPYGAVFTYSVGQAPAGDAKLVLNITDDAGRAVRRMEVPQGASASIASPGICAGEPPAQPAGETGGRGGRGRYRSGGGDDQEQPEQAVGRGSQPQGPLVAAGRYRATLATVNGESLTADRAAPNLCRGSAATLMSYIARPAVLKLKGFGRRLSRESRPAIPSAGGDNQPTPARECGSRRDASRARVFGLLCGSNEKVWYSRESRITDYSGIHLCWCRAGSSDPPGGPKARP